MSNGTKLSMADILARARLSKEIAAMPQPKDTVGALPAVRKPQEFTDNRQLQKQAAHAAHAVANVHTGGKLNIEALRARLALATKKESERVTEAAHIAGALPIDEEIVASIDIVAAQESPQQAAKQAVQAEALGMHGEAITYNKEQQAFVNLISEGNSCILIGAAGTGKTTCSKGGISALIANGKIPVLQNDGHKHLKSGTPGVIIISYTRRAVNNIRKVQSEDLKANCITSHKLLEYAPVDYVIQDPETGLDKRTMRFEPSRNSGNVLPTTISTIVVEEASMLSLELFTELENALAHAVQWVFIGDIQQLPPVFGSAILGFKMLELPVIELTQVYRQALESPIIRLAHRILSGKPIPASEYPDWKVAGKLTLHPWKKKLSGEHACMTLAAFFKAAYDKGEYDIEEDIILIPYNQSCGTIELNKHIANHISKKNDVLTYEVMAGFEKLYFSVGDKVLYDKEDAEIISITKNPAYGGKKVQFPSKNLDYWGHNCKLREEMTARAMDPLLGDTDMDIDIDAVLDIVASETENRVLSCSHLIEVRLADTMQVVTLKTASEINALLLSYALTVHKSQGSEWRKVFFCLHQSHATMLQRELLYTGVTRAREELYVICEPESFTKGILSQKIKGNTLAEKAEFFKGKVANK